MSRDSVIYLMQAWLPLLAVAGGFYFLMRRWPLAALAVALALVAAATAYGVSTTRDWTWANRSHLLIYAESAVQAAIPAVVLLLLAYGATRVAHHGLRWAILAVGTGAFALVWPLVAIYVVCASGLDCI